MKEKKERRKNRTKELRKGVGEGEKRTDLTKRKDMKSRVCLALINYLEHDSYPEVWLVYPVILCWRLLICHFPTWIIKKILCYDWAFVFIATCPCSNFVFWELVQVLCMLSQSLEFYLWINSVVLERHCFHGFTYHLDF